MTAPVRIGVFLAGLLIVFGAAVALGSAVDPAETESGGGHGDPHAMKGGGEAPAGLAVADGEYSLLLGPTHLRQRQERELRFTIEAGGAPVTEFDELHERRLHLIVVRRDGTGFRHLHPEMEEGGTWTVPIAFAEPGVYRAFADFSVHGEQHTLATDVFVSGGDFQPRPFPAPRPSTTTDGYEVRLETDGLTPGEPASLAFSVSEGGEPVTDLAPYLGAKGHLVALREGDLAYLHVHPEETGDGIAFGATFPASGRYRLYLQFRHHGAVHTAEFTVLVPR